ncbi:hypothetical protein [Rickettsia endosymbiont of Urophora cardui]
MLYKFYLCNKATKIGRDKSTICYELKRMRHNYRPDRANTLALLHK